MLPDKKLLEMLSNPEPQVRLMALDQLGGHLSPTPELQAALEKAAHDKDHVVADKAHRLIHHEPITTGQSLADIPSAGDELHKFNPTSPEALKVEVASAYLEKVADKKGSVEAQLSASTKNKDLSNTLPSRSMTDSEQNNYDFLQVMQGLTFVISIISFAWIIINKGGNLFSFGAIGWLLILNYIIFIVLQIVAILKYGFLNSFKYVQVIGMVILIFLASGRRRR